MSLFQDFSLFLKESMSSPDTDTGTNTDIRHKHFDTNIDKHTHTYTIRVNVFHSPSHVLTLLSQTSYGKLKEKLHAWIKRYHIFDSVREKSNAFRLDMPKNRTEKETEVSESALRYPTNSSSQSEIQEDSTTNSSDQSDNSEVESSESEEVRKKKKNRAKIAKKKHVKESKDVPIYDTSSDDIVDCGLSESEERIEDIFS